MGLEVAATVAALDAIISRLPGAALKAARGMGTVGERGIKANLNRTTHTKNTPTPSMPGSPPSRVSGDLSDSVRKTSETPGIRASVDIAPTTVYARIQELGGVSGDDHRAHLPPRPYVRPVLTDYVAEYRQAAIDAFRGAL
jgi:phage gpG-like protein